MEHVENDVVATYPLGENHHENGILRRTRAPAVVLSHAREQAYFAWLVQLSDIYGISKRLAWEPRTDSKLLVKEMTIAK